MNTDNKTNTETHNDQASFDPSPDAEFLREKIKQKPINKKKLLRRTLISVSSAAIFGIVACVTFLLLEPLISSRISKKEAPEKEVSSVVLPDVEDEISPEDMYATDTEMIEEVLQGNVSEVNEDIKHIEELISGIQFDVDDYRVMYSQLREMTDTAAKSIVTVTGYSTSTDLLNNLHENNAKTSGLIIAENGPSLLILVYDNELSIADSIQVTFFDGSISRGTIMGTDPETNYLVVAVTKSTIPISTLAEAVPASLGSSKSATLKGSPVMAVGSPTGVTDSISYGMITSDVMPLDFTDADYNLIATDIMGSPTSSGILINLRGFVIGIIDTANTGSETQISAIGITELKPLIEKLSNREEKAYLGIHGTDITEEMAKTYNLPDGIYLSNIEMDSPAMIAGLQNGDILTSIDGEAPEDYHHFISWLYSASPDQTYEFTIRRQSVDSYISINVSVTLGSVNYKIGTEE